VDRSPPKNLTAFNLVYFFPFKFPPGPSWGVIFKMSFCRLILFTLWDFFKAHLPVIAPVFFFSLFLVDCPWPCLWDRHRPYGTFFLKNLRPAPFTGAESVPPYDFGVVGLYLESGIMIYFFILCIHDCILFSLDFRIIILIFFFMIKRMTVLLLVFCIGISIIPMPADVFFYSLICLLTIV
jgi:hypothetical protein